MNGPRVAAQILNLVPNKEVYRQVLRLIKLWAKSKMFFPLKFSLFFLRKTNIFKRHGLPWWCFLGYSSCSSLSALSQSECSWFSRSLFSVLMFLFFFFSKNNKTDSLMLLFYKQRKTKMKMDFCCVEILQRVGVWLASSYCSLSNRGDS